ncbi:MAG: hypothetical protein J6S14_15725 [Clostridia bacterium]|nr:hypothetical protein [Clostridia bacterium]
MKKIINGKKYDTGTAKELGIWSNSYYPGDFAYCSETLYRKKTGEYFLYGIGGPMSKYAEHIGSNTTIGGSNIKPMTESEAREWAETHLDAEEYEEIFGEVEE